MLATSRYALASSEASELGRSSFENMALRCLLAATGRTSRDTLGFARKPVVLPARRMAVLSALPYLIASCLIHTSTVANRN